MSLIQANCRVQLTGKDIDFILEVLKPGIQDKSCLERLLLDEETRDLILDDQQLLRAILEHPGYLPISTHLYFYILVRHAFRQAGLQDRHIADYVAEMLSQFSRTERTQLKVDGKEGSLDYMFEMMGALQEADEITRFYIRTHVGNTSLFLSGVFHEHIRSRAERRGAPGLAYYENLGRSNFRAASDHRLALKYRLTGVFHTLADRFQETRLALNELGERLLVLSDPDCSKVLKLDLE